MITARIPCAVHTGTCSTNRKRDSGRTHETVKPSFSLKLDMLPEWVRLLHRGQRKARFFHAPASTRQHVQWSQGQNLTPIDLLSSISLDSGAAESLSHVIY